MASFLVQNSLHTLLTSSQSHKPLRHTITYASLPARDRIIDFGKYKGKMLGTLPSTYLKWVSNNLRARDFEEWAKLADQVLEDPVYNDRIEWEFAEKLLNGDVFSKSEGTVVDLVEISQRFGWDNEDKIGWSKIDFELLGSSKGGRIPRVRAEKSGEELKGGGARRRGGGSGGEGRKEVGMREKRVERRDRLKLKREMPKFENVVEDDEEEEDEGSIYRKREESLDCNGEVYNPFPGRETLLKKVLNRRRR